MAGRSTSDIGSDYARETGSLSEILNDRRGSREACPERLFSDRLESKIFDYYI